MTSRRPAGWPGSRSSAIEAGGRTRRLGGAAPGRSRVRRGGLRKLEDGRCLPWHPILCRTRLIIPMIIQTILLYPSGAVWTDEASNGSRLDPSGAFWFDGEHPSRNRKVVGSNPTSGSKTAGQRVCTVLPPMVLLASLIILVRRTVSGRPAPILSGRSWSARFRGIGGPRSCSCGTRPRTGVPGNALPGAPPRGSPPARAAGAVAARRCRQPT
jgi:hypothetical protein